MATHHEVERTYAPEPDAVVPDLTGVGGVALVGEPVTHRLVATYLDTADLRLIRAGVTLRRREGGPDEGWHLKIPVGGGRDELQAPLGSTVVPLRLRRVVLGLTRGAPLAAVATVTTTRTTRTLLSAEGTVLAELADDHVVAAPADGDEVAWREWEVELVAGDDALLDAVEAVLAEAGVEASSVARKIARVLPTAPVPGTKPPKPGKPVRRVLGPWLVEQVDELLRRDLELRRGGALTPVAVHRARVACRRLRSALSAYGPCWDRDVVDPLRDELRWLAGALAPARDAEVVRERLRLLVEDELRVVGPVRRQLRMTFSVRQRGAYREVATTLESARHLALLERLQALVEDPPWTRMAEEPAADVLAERLRREWKRVRRAYRALPADATDDDLHDVRKSTKRLRYAAEIAEPMLGSDVRRLRKAAKGLTQVLGELQDTAVSREQLLTLAIDSTKVGESAFTYGRLHAREEQRARELRLLFEVAWLDLADAAQRTFA